MSLQPEIIENFKKVSQLIFVPMNEDDYNQTVELLDAITDLVRDDEDHPLANVMDVLGVLVENYEQQNISEPDSDQKNDALTLEIMKAMETLPISKKMALLELLKNFPSTMQSAKPVKKKGRLSAERKKELLSISAWSEEEVAEIEKAREYTNTWTPKTF